MICLVIQQDMVGKKTVRLIAETRTYRHPNGFLPFASSEALSPIPPSVYRHVLAIPQRMTASLMVHKLAPILMGQGETEERCRSLHIGGWQV